jgi:hypothetical protein
MQSISASIIVLSGAICLAASFPPGVDIGRAVAPLALPGIALVLIGMFVWITHLRRPSDP